MRFEYRLLSPEELAKRIDYAILRDPTPHRVVEAVEEAEKLGLRAVTVFHTMLTWLEGVSRRVLISVVIDFPSGASHIEPKVKAVEQAIAHGAGEVEFVVNVWQWMKGNRDYVINEVRALSRIAREVGVKSKAIIESSLLDLSTLQEILEAIAALDKEDRPDYVKMNTGWFSRGVEPLEVALAAKIVKPRGMMIKASGGIKDGFYASLLVALGADVIGTSNPSKLIRDLQEAKKLLS
ncbi:deoxyribose-phosphate aldolase [Pyrolobus fumarii 1A]|uniref:Deoxyribose-phosphate aldolase n=1 Tax=Pyrolobus fumarii (strain DSM 11204 / 1A) TaxID=694429 RepID=G0EGC6_PYRF1|nr:deoxyribose-phosphate aldolase [Pyrolobus fumarii]AEM39151.1 deoxyribose-phosphate aldolase [Pyrolobus fumarii 1A]